jgi:anti-sigma-K factor RskA
MTDRRDMPGLPPEDDVALAGEFVLGVLGAQEMRAAARRAAEDPAFAALVARWRTDLGTLDAETDPVAPPPRVLAGIESRLFGRAQRRRGGWASGFLGGLIAAGLAALVMVAVLAPPQAPGALVATIASEDQAFLVQASYDPGAGVLSVSRVAGAPPAGRVLELWAIAEGSAPLSLGLLAEGQTVLALPDDLRGRVAGLTLAVSEEPPGGSPTGAPTGAVLGAGALSGA